MKHFFSIIFVLSSLNSFAMPERVQCQMETGNKERTSIYFDAQTPELISSTEKQERGRWIPISSKALLEENSVCNFSYNPSEDCYLELEEVDQNGIYVATWTWYCSQNSIKLETQVVRMGQLRSTILARCYDKGQILDTVSGNNCQF